MSAWNWQVSVKEDESGAILVLGCSLVVIEKVFGGEMLPWGNLFLTLSSYTRGMTAPLCENRVIGRFIL